MNEILSKSRYGNIVGMDSELIDSVHDKYGKAFDVILKDGDQECKHSMIEIIMPAAEDVFEKAQIEESAGRFVDTVVVNRQEAIDIVYNAFPQQGNEAEFMDNVLSISRSLCAQLSQGGAASISPIPRVDPLENPDNVPMFVGVVVPLADQTGGEQMVINLLGGQIPEGYDAKEIVDLLGEEFLSRAVVLHEIGHQYFNAVHYDQLKELENDTYKNNLKECGADAFMTAALFEHYGADAIEKIKLISDFRTIAANNGFQRHYTSPTIENTLEHVSAIGENNLQGASAEQVFAEAMIGFSKSVMERSAFEEFCQQGVNSSEFAIKVDSATANLKSKLEMQRYNEQEILPMAAE